MSPIGKMLLELCNSASDRRDLCITLEDVKWIAEVKKANTQSVKWLCLYLGLTIVALDVSKNGYSKVRFLGLLQKRGTVLDWIHP